MSTNGNHKKRRLRNRIIGLAVVLLIIGGTGFALLGSLRRPPSIDPSKIATVERGPIARSVVATGKVQPRTKVEVKSKASGLVKKIYADYGQYVKQGDILVELDKEELAARVRELKATMQVAQASVHAAQASLERSKVEAEGPDLPYLKSSMERSQLMLRDKLVARTIAEDSERAYQLALNKQTSSIRSLAVARAEIQKAEATVAQTKAALDQAEENLRNSTIVSPMTGLVLSKDVEVGDAVSSILVMGSQATLIMTLGDVSEVYVLGKVDQADIGKVYLNQKSRIVVESFKDRKFEGEVTKISPLGVEKDNVTTFEVRVSIRNPGGVLKANMSANAEIILEEKPNVLLIPESAIAYDKDRKAAVSVPDPTQKNGKRKVPVEVGLSNGVKTELVAGLKQGDKLVVE
ncbi:MAG: efflux RND transporter periplasmic adaptor subunit [Acidobacteria bacterium]|nr:efflux RND transporter periplasmic adaptor subunit [Acidobacteriota bacterium]